MNSNALGQFNARNGPNGLLLRFARSRVREFWTRQTMTLLGSLVMGVLGSVWLGLIAACLAFAGDALDCFVLAQIARQHPCGIVPAFARRLALITGAVQATTISACVVLCWRGIAVEEAKFFAAAFLMSAVINAGVARRHFRQGVSAKLAIYLLTVTTLVSGDLTIASGSTLTTGGFFLGTLAIMAYTAVLFIRALEKGQTERLRFEQALLTESGALEQSRHALAETSRRAERLALVAQHASDSVIITAPNGKIEWVNAAFSKITGYQFDEAVGRLPGDILNGPDTAPDALATLIAAQQQGLPCRVEIQNRTKEGALLWMEISMTPVFRPDGVPEVYVAVERDVTQSKALISELARAHKVAEAAAEAKSQFLATMSHEIRTPMNGVIGIAELLNDTGLRADQQRYVTTIIESGNALLTIINDVLDLSKLRSGKADLLSDPFLINDCVTGALELLRPIASKKGLEVVLNLPTQSLTYLGDPGRLRQILINLIGNAVKFTGKGKISVTLSIIRGLEFDQISIAVSDTGIGIPAHQMGHLFDCFAQADASISRQFGGTGLGLSISQVLARQMGGDIVATSIAKEGSVFTTTVRLARANNIEVASRQTAPTIPKTNLRVLIAEDNRTNMLIARKLLTQSVAHLTEATNGRLAVQAYRDAPPDLVLMDVSMPEMNGYDASVAIRAHERDFGLRRCPIIALTAYVAADEEARCLAAGMDRVLTKPLAREKLYAVLQSVTAARDRFDEAPCLAVDRRSNGEQTWSISQPGSTTTTGKLIRSSGH